MVLAGIIIGALALLGFAVSVSIEMANHNGGYSFVGWICGGLFILGIYVATTEPDKENNPSAMDVYQGKTTLEYTIVDGVVKDSTVIWKTIDEIEEE